MKIWIDLTNSPHVNFFETIINDLRNDHEVILTCRPLANTIELLDLFKFSYYIVGKHYGRNVLKKACGFLVRVVQLYKFLRDKKVDIAISHSSFYSPLVAKLIGARCIYLNDNEFAIGNRVSFIFADLVLIPEYLDIRNIKANWERSDKIKKYPGLKEGIYLWKYKSNILNGVKSIKSQHEKTIYFRPEPLSAQYYKGQQNFIDDLLVGLQRHAQIVLLPRTNKQRNYYRQKKFRQIYVPEKTIHLSQIFNTCDLFIGAGGTMTREAAVLGIPTISIYQDDLLEVDKFLVNEGFMIHHKKVTAEMVLQFLSHAEKKAPNNILMQKGERAFHFIKNLIMNDADYISKTSLTRKEST